MGPEPTVENRIGTLRKALDHGFDIELDLWFDGRDLFLGHDRAQYRTDYDQLWSLADKGKVYVHCKNVYTLQHFLRIRKEDRHHENMIPFFHHEDDCILLENGLVWLHPKAIDVVMTYQQKTITVLPHLRDFDYYPTSMISKFYGVCTDYPMSIKETVETW